MLEAYICVCTYFHIYTYTYIYYIYTQHLYVTAEIMKPEIQFHLLYCV